MAAAGVVEWTAFAIVARRGGRTPTLRSELIWWCYVDKEMVD